MEIGELGFRCVERDSCDGGILEQPFGTLTLVFTDVEGSTRLLHELGERGYRDALAEHRRVVRQACRGHDGYEVDYEGDSFFYAFRSATAAVEAVQEAGAGLAAGPIRVRVGMHTGEPGLDPPKYVGLDVHLAARVMAAGHGGQVLLSAATASLVEAPMTELGKHHLKDFAEPVTLFQLGSKRFPPLKTIGNTNLPRPASSFIGREREVAEVVALLRGGARLVTLSGPGGSGKTRLAIEAAAELVGDFNAGVFWVGLAGLRESPLVLRAVAQTLGVTDLVGQIEERELLLLLDNFEQVVDASPDVASLVEACPNLRVLVTSRELLRVRGEVRYDVPPLESADAVTLFSVRSQLEETPEIVELCRRLDDLPLALELAAARTNVLTPAQTLERLGERLDLFRGGRDAVRRQQTLRATIGWSYELLTEDEKRHFGRLTVFPGGCTLEAAEHVTGSELDVLQSLVEKSLLRHSGERFWMLETVREYGLEQLEMSGEAERLRRRSAEFLLDLARRSGFAYDSTLPERHDLVNAELVNIRDALTWAVEEDVELGVELLAELETFFDIFDLFEGRRWADSLLERASGRGDSLRALALRLHGNFLYLVGEFDEGYRQLHEAHSLYQQLGDARGRALVELTLALYLQSPGGEPDRARRLCESSLAEFQRAGSSKGEMAILQVQTYIEKSEANWEKGLALALQAVRLCEQGGWRSWLIPNLQNAGECALRLDRLDEAAIYERQLLRRGREIGDRWSIPSALPDLARIAAASQDAYRAGLLFGAVEAESVRSPFGQWEVQDRELVARELEAVAGPEFERGIAAGKDLSLDAAIEIALDEGPN